MFSWTDLVFFVALGTLVVPGCDGQTSGGLGTVSAGPGGESGSSGTGGGASGQGGVTSGGASAGDGGSPEEAKSCATGMACGQDGDDCCGSIALPGGVFNRLRRTGNPPAAEWDADVAPFLLDKYEVTVRRFRTFADAYPGSRPTAGDGAHELFPGSGWRDEWPLPADKAGLFAAMGDSVCLGSWTDEPGANEQLPINCLDWYLAFAFCAWDGGRLPIATEIFYAIRGGDEQRWFPWSMPAGSKAIDHSFAVFSDPTPAPPLSGPEAVGSRPAGASRWGHLDLTGNVEEMVADQGGALLAPCGECARVASGGPIGGIAYLGGSYRTVPAGLPEGQDGEISGPDERDRAIGVRCARRAP